MRRPALRARRALIVAPHPDDEAIGAWALMRRLLQSGARVDLLVVSDGSASHPASRAWPVPRLVAERRRETRRAMAALGLSPSRVRFLGMPDGGLSAAERRLQRQLGRAVLRRAAPDLIVGPTADDAHADHRAVASALVRLPRRGERRIGYQVWPEGAARSLHDVVVPLDTGARAIKRRVVRSYRTQAGLITDATAGFAMTHRHLRAFVRPTERFRVLG